MKRYIYTRGDNSVSFSTQKGAFDTMYDDYEEALMKLGSKVKSRRNYLNTASIETESGEVFNFSVKEVEV